MKCLLKLQFSVKVYCKIFDDKNWVVEEMNQAKDNPQNSQTILHIVAREE